MRTAVRLLLVLLVPALAACGGGGGTTSQPPAAPVALATLDVVRTGGFASSRAELHLTPGDPELPAAEEALGLPLPAGSTLTAATPDAYVYDVTAVLNDGTSGSWTFDDASVPGDLEKLHAWLATQL